MKIVILILVAVALVLVWRLDEINSHLDETNLPLDGINLLGAFLLATLMLGLIWWKWAIEKKKDKTRQTIALRILDNLDGHRQQALSNLQRAGPNTQQRIKKTIREELRRRPADEIALMLLDGGIEMQKLMGKILPQMPIKIRRDISRAIKEEGRRREAWVKIRRDINRAIEEEQSRREAWEEEQERHQREAREEEQERRRREAREEEEERHRREAWEEEQKRRQKEAREKEEEQRRREAQERSPEEREIDRLFEGNIEQNTNNIALRFFSGEFQHREYVIKKIRETSPEFQRHLTTAIRQTQNTLLNNPEAFMQGNAFVYLIRQEYFAIEQFFFKIGWARNPGNRLQQFQTGNPHLLHLWAAMSFPDDAAARQKEAELHKVCRAWREHSEWFQGHALEELLRNGRFTPYFKIPRDFRLSNAP